MSFVSVNSERNTTKKLCQVVSASLCNGKHFEGKEKGKFASWKCKECGCPYKTVLARLQSLFSISTFECLTHQLGVVWLQTNIAHCIQSGFFNCYKRRLKLENGKQWKIFLRWIQLKTKSFQLLFLCKGGQLGKLNSNCSRGRGNWVGGGGRACGSRFWPRRQQMHDFNRN